MPLLTLPGRPHYRGRRHHARYQSSHQNRLGMLSTELFDRPSAPLRLKARLLKAEAMEALLYGCMTWAPRNAHYRQVRTTHHKLLLRVIEYRRVHGTHRNMSYAKALKETGSDGFCSQGPWPDRVRSDSRSGCRSPGDSWGGKTRAPASRHSTGRNA